MNEHSNPIPPSRWFDYRNGTLHCEDVPLDDIAARVGTPCFVYSGASIDEAITSISNALSFTEHKIAYAVKANGNLAILSRIRSHGCGADIVSGGELERALRAGFDPQSIIFSGVGKTEAEISRAVEVGIRAIHLESVQELDAIERVAQRAGRSVEIGLRVNPNVDPQTHPYISTGLRNSKFGIALERARTILPRIAASQHVHLGTIACHIGSQLGSPAPLREAVEIVGRFVIDCLNDGHPIRAMDVGGGWPMAYGHESSPYPPHVAFGDAIRDGLEASGVLERGLTIFTEPGRAIVGDAGVLLTRVLYTKPQGEASFVIVDGAMTELIRPALYSAYHAVVPVTARGGARMVQSIVGPVCESGDFFAKDRSLPPLVSGELVALRGAGAYGREMQSMYNARLPAPEVLVDGAEMRIVRKRLSINALWAGEEDT